MTADPRHVDPREAAYGTSTAAPVRRRLLTRVDDVPPLSRRSFLFRAGAGGLAVAGAFGARSWLAPLADRGLLSADGVFDATAMELADSLYDEVFPTSPLVLAPFTDALPVPRALTPVPRSRYSAWDRPPGPGPGQQNSMSGTNADQHQKWPSSIGYPDPLVYEIDLLVATHRITTSKVLPIGPDGAPAVSFRGTTRVAAGTVRDLPASTIYGFNGTLPGPLINAEYGKPVLVRFTNRLDENPGNLDRQDFGSPDWSFLTHLHNGHTAPESDGNPHYSGLRGPRSAGYRPGTWVDNLYLNWPAGGDDREKQSFFWFHDHRMDHTGSNVYKGMVGLYPIYDPKNRLDAGDERFGYRLPGVRRNRADGAFDVDYDIPLAFSDVRLDDGVTRHHDVHDLEFPAAGNPRTHPEWWGTTFFRHFPNHGFVGDVFTVNGVAYPTLRVKRRSYRLRFLDASVARIYEFQLMSSTRGPRAARELGYTGDELQGQYRLTDGQQCMRFLEVATDGGLVPFAFTRDSFELWPAKRREVVVDFLRYQDGTPTSPGDVIYLTNVMKMPDGRMWENSSRSSPDPAYVVPVLKIVIEGGAPPVDDSRVFDGKALRPLRPLPSGWKTLLADRMVFEVTRGSGGGEVEWLINGEPFDPTVPATSLRNPAGRRPPAQQPMGSFNVWEIRNGGGGWVHPFHLHMEEHRTVVRDGRDVSGRNRSPGRPDDFSREDTIGLDPGESVIVYRGFRDFRGPYVAHCHNLAHEDHAMMFGWEIT